jgi:uncharacterized membrane protein
MPDFIRPNYHPMLVNFPVGLLVMGVLIELLSFMYRRHPVRQAGRCMILIGALWALPAVTSGLYAMWDVASHRNPNLITWQDVINAKLLTAAQWKLLHKHLLLTCVGMGMCLAASLWWLGSSDRWRQWSYLPMLGVLVAGVVIGGIGVHKIGNAVFIHGLAVEPSPADAGTVHPSYASTNNDENGTWRAAVDSTLNPRQVHVILGGFACSVALLVIALCVRRTVHASERLAESVPQTQIEEPQLNASIPDRNQLMVAAIRSVPDGSRAAAPKIPAATFGLLAVLLTLAAAVVGLYVAGITDWPAFQSDFLRAQSNLEMRDRLHAMLGAAMLVLLLLLACIARFAPRSGFAVGIFSCLLLMVIAAQLWMGPLLLLDGSTGPLNGFNTKSPSPQTMQPTTAATTMPTTAPAGG